MQPICEGVSRFPGMIVGSVYLIEDPDGVTLVDTSIAPSAKKILRQLERAGRRPADVRRILITHAHPDHVGGLPALKQATGAQVIASAAERPVIEGRQPIARPARSSLRGLSKLLLPPKTTLTAVPVDREVGDGELLPEVLGGLQVVATPGHAPGHLSFWQPERRVLFCGDVIFHLLGLRLPPSFLTVDMEEDKRSIRRLVELDAAVVCFGHGQPLVDQAGAQLRAFAAKLGI